MDGQGQRIGNSFHHCCSSLAEAEEVPANFHLAAGVYCLQCGLVPADDCANFDALDDHASLEHVRRCNMGHHLHVKHIKLHINNAKASNIMGGKIVKLIHEAERWLFVWNC